MLHYIIAVFSLIIIFTIVKVNNIYKYWEKKGVKGPTPTPLIGNFKTMILGDDSLNTLAVFFYKKYQNEKVVGLYQGLTPVLLIRDPEIIKRILVNDFPNFDDRGFFFTKQRLSKSLFTLAGPERTFLRQKLNTLFTANKLKQMMPSLKFCVEDYVKHLNELTKENVPIDVQTLNRMYGVKVACALAFSLDINTFSEKNNTFMEISNRVFPIRTKFLDMIAMIDAILPDIFLKLGITIDVNQKGVPEFFINLVQQIAKQNESKRKSRLDFIDFMFELQKQGTVKQSNDEKATEIKITENYISSQAILFFAGTYEGPTALMSLMLHELAFNLDIQERCYKEITQTFKKYGDLTYEAINELKYVTMAFDEALRKFDFGILVRKCVNNSEIPEVNITVEKGTKILISTTGLHYDPQYHPDPEKYDPERFSAERKGSIQSYTYLPFGDGPKNCIGLRLGKFIAILGISHFLNSFRVTPCEKTAKRLKYNPLNTAPNSVGGIWLNIERRS